MAKLQEHMLLWYYSSIHQDHATYIKIKNNNYNSLQDKGKAEFGLWESHIHTVEIWVQTGRKIKILYLKILFRLYKRFFFKVENLNPIKL
jgi:hypothetical protein